MHTHVRERGQDHMEGRRDHIAVRPWLAAVVSMRPNRNCLLVAAASIVLASSRKCTPNCSPVLCYGHGFCQRPLQLTPSCRNRRIVYLGNNICYLVIVIYFFVFVYFAEFCDAASEYFGRYIGPMSRLLHSVSGEVYAVDARTLHIRDFTYDGEGPGNFSQIYLITTKNCK